MRIYIPTRNRINKQVTLSNIPDDWESRTYLVCSPEEAPVHEKLGRQVLICPVSGIGNEISNRLSFGTVFQRRSF
jgi:hypothetical protein